MLPTLRCSFCARVLAVRTDGANRLSALTDPFDNTYRYSYDLEGRRTRLDLPNGVAVEYSYDTLDRLTGITQRTSSSLLASYNYTLDPSGNRLGVTEADGSSIAWAYDDAYRLIGETRLDPGGTPTSETNFTYDPVGNRLAMTVDGATTNYTYNKLDQLLTAGGTSFAYDARGNVTRLHRVRPEDLTLGRRASPESHKQNPPKVVRVPAALAFPSISLMPNGAKRPHTLIVT